MARTSLVRACARSRCAWNTKKLVWMPAANFFSSASSRFPASCARRARRLDALLVGLDRARRLAHLRHDLQLEVPELRLRLLHTAACARARLVCCVLVPSG